MKRRVSHLQAIGFALAGFTFWVLSDGCIKFVTGAHLPPYEIVGILGLSATGLILLKAAWRNEMGALWPKNLRRQLAQTCLSTVSGFSVVVGLGHLPLTLFYILIFMAPMIVTVLAAIFLNERLDWKKVLAVLFGFAGVLVAVHPGTEDMRGDWVGYVALTVAAVTFAINAVWVRHMMQRRR